MMPELKLRPPIEKGKELWVGLNRLRNKFRDCHYRPHMSGIHRRHRGFRAAYRSAMPGNATTYFVRVSSATAENVYRKSGYVLGIRARGAMGGTRAVERERACDKAETSPHRLKPGCGANTYGTTKVAPSRIVNPAGLSRERQVEVCAQCHGGSFTSERKGNQGADAESLDQTVFGPGELNICGGGHDWKCMNKLLRDSASVG